MSDFKINYMFIINGLNAIITLVTSVFNVGEILSSLELPEINGDVDWEFVPRIVPEGNYRRTHLPLVSWINRGCSNWSNVLDIALRF